MLPVDIILFCHTIIKESIIIRRINMPKSKEMFKNEEQFIAIISQPVAKMSIMELDYAVTYMHINHKKFTGEQMILFVELSEQLEYRKSREVKKSTPEEEQALLDEINQWYEGGQSPFATPQKQTINLDPEFIKVLKPYAKNQILNMRKKFIEETDEAGGSKVILKPTFTNNLK